MTTGDTSITPDLEEVLAPGRTDRKTIDEADSTGTNAPFSDLADSNAPERIGDEYDDNGTEHIS